MDIAAAIYILKLRFDAILAAYSPAATATLGLIMAVLCVNYFMRDTPPLLHLLTAVSIGGLAYCGSLFWFQRDTVEFIGQHLRSSLARA